MWFFDEEMSIGISEFIVNNATSGAATEIGKIGGQQRK
jgi:hypothetical protein